MQAQAQRGALADHLADFGRSLRSAGVQIDAERIALSIRAALLAGLASRDDLCAALEAVLVSRERDRLVFRELFEIWFQPDRGAADSPDQRALAAPAHMLASRVADAIADRLAGNRRGADDGSRLECDASATSTLTERLRHAEFSTLDADEYRQVEQLVRQITLPLPVINSRRKRIGARGVELHWPGVLRQAARGAGDVFELPRLQRRDEPLPLLVLVDISGSMQRYSRLLLAFLHAATRGHRQRDIFAFGTRLSNLTPSFRQADTDQMLLQAAAAIPDFAGGTRLGDALASLRRQHGQRFVGRRSMVLIVSDGLDTGDPADLGRELGWVKRHCRQLLWLNPLLRFAAYTPAARGARQLHRHADAMLAVHDLGKLQDLAASLASLLQQRQRR